MPLHFQKGKDRDGEPGKRLLGKGELRTRGGEFARKGDGFIEEEEPFLCQRGGKRNFLASDLETGGMHEEEAFLRKTSPK